MICSSNMNVIDIFSDQRQRIIAVLNSKGAFPQQQCSSENSHYHNVIRSLQEWDQMHLCTLKYPRDVNYLATTPFHFGPCWFGEVVWGFFGLIAHLGVILNYLQAAVCPWKKLGMFKARNFVPQAVLERTKGVLSVSS